MSRVFQERTNCPVPAIFSLSAPPNPIMDAPTTAFFNPGPDSLYVSKTPNHEKPQPTLDSQNYPGERRVSRVKRYLVAEQKLVESFQRCQQENSPSELQIKALRKATAILNGHVADAGERVVKLQKLLDDRAVEPALYQSMQRQRWMEERRQDSVERLSKVVQQHLSTVVLAPQPLQPITLMRKSDANLVRFFESSSQVTRNQRRRRIPAASRSRLDKKLAIPRIHHHKHVLPLLLTVPKQGPTLSYLLREEPSAVITTLASRPSPIPPVQPPLDSILEVPDLECPAQPLISPIDTNGTATIWKDPPRSTEDILAELVVDIPDYVVDLLAGLDSISSHSLTIADSEAPTSSWSATSVASTTMPDTPQDEESIHVMRVPSPIPSLLHKPSRKRLTGLFSLPEGLVSRRGLSIDAGQPKRSHKRSIQMIAEPSPRPFSVSMNGAMSSSYSGGSQAPEHDEDDKMLLRLMRRMSGLQFKRR